MNQKLTRSLLIVISASHWWVTAAHLRRTGIRVVPVAHVLGLLSWRGWLSILRISAWKFKIENLALRRVVNTITALALLWWISWTKITSVIINEPYRGWSTCVWSGWVWREATLVLKFMDIPYTLGSFRSETYASWITWSRILPRIAALSVRRLGLLSITLILRWIASALERYQILPETVKHHTCWG